MNNNYINMKFITATLFSLGAFGMAAPSPGEKIKLPLIANVENTFHPVFDDKPVECTQFNIKLNNLDKVDRDWLNQHGGESLILTEENIVIKIRNNDTYKPNKHYNVVENHAVEIYNQGILVFKTSYKNFKNMMSYADNMYSFLYIPITIMFYECN